VREAASRTRSCRTPFSAFQSATAPSPIPMSQAALCSLEHIRTDLHEVGLDHRA
jgi:hypothetical protein